MHRQHNPKAAADILRGLKHAPVLKVGAHIQCMFQDDKGSNYFDAVVSQHIHGDMWVVEIAEEGEGLVKYNVKLSTTLYAAAEDGWRWPPQSCPKCHGFGTVQTEKTLPSGVRSKIQSICTKCGGIGTIVRTRS
jgi:DnaJ-class molecular chaperone